MGSVTLDRVNKSWGAFQAVKDFDMEIADGEFLVLLGPSGCGKTTTMRMIAGLEDVTAGDILFGGRRVNDLAPKDRDVAMVFQNYGLYPHMSVRENIGYPLRIRGVSKAEQAERIARAADRVEIEPLLDRKPKALSGGQRQRVALARAIVREPSVFLMDEPLSNLDAKLRVSMRAEIKHLHHEQGVTTVYVTHDQIEAMTLADRVVVMDKGRVQQVGTPEDIYNDPDHVFVAGFIGSPAMNLIRGDLDAGAFVAAGVRVPGVGRGSRPGVTLGARPEDLDLCQPEDGHIKAPVYSFELLGEATQTTLRLPDRGLLVVKGAKGERHALDATIGVRLEPERAYLFEAETGRRIRET